MSNARSGNEIRLNRREALCLSASAAIGVAAGEPGHVMDSTQAAAPLEPGNCSTPKTAIANTQYGKVRGFVDGGVFTFKGIPYGQNTGGANRWLPAKPPTPWKDAYPALIYGANCPQHLHDYTQREQSFLLDYDDGYMSEDMLKLNLWTPSLSGSRAVMVYFHGGVFAFGSSYELPSHEGANMARYHDVVQVSVNHRLNVLGFFDVSEVGGSEYEQSVNVGMSDLVASLRWVKENISNFGGDPDRVMIYGQSGGGYKVTTLMGMPSASGLIHRACAQSGGGQNLPSMEQSREFSRQVIKRLGIAPRDISALQRMDWSTLVSVGNAVAAQINPPPSGLSGPGHPQPVDPLVGWVPTVDGQVINCRAFYDIGPEVSRDVPIIIGNVSEEGMHYRLNPSEEEWQSSLSGLIGESKATRLIAAMKKSHPEKSIRTLSYGVTGVSARNNVQKMIKLKYDQHGAPAYQYYFTWQSPMLDGVAGAWHTADLAFCFDNTKRCEQATGNTPEARALAKKTATAWANFAKTGNPSQPGLTWDPSDPTRCQTMVWDNHPRMVDDPEGESRRILLG